MTDLRTNTQISPNNTIFVQSDTTVEPTQTNTSQSQTQKIPNYFYLFQNQSTAETLGLSKQRNLEDLEALLAEISGKLSELKSLAEGSSFFAEMLKRSGMLNIVQSVFKDIFGHLGNIDTGREKQVNLEQSLSTTQSALADAESALSNITKSIGNIAKEIGGAIGDIVTGNIDNLKNRKKALEAEASTIRDNINTLKESIETIGNEIANVGAAIAGSLASILSIVTSVLPAIESLIEATFRPDGKGTTAKEEQLQNEIEELLLQAMRELAARSEILAAQSVRFSEARAQLGDLSSESTTGVTSTSQSVESDIFGNDAFGLPTDLASTLEGMISSLANNSELITNKTMEFVENLAAFYGGLEQFTQSPAPQNNQDYSLTGRLVLNL